MTKPLFPPPPPPTPAELREALRQIQSALHKTRACAATLSTRSRYKSQLTLATRRIRALEISSTLILRALAESGSPTE